WGCSTRRWSARRESSCGRPTIRSLSSFAATSARRRIGPSSPRRKSKSPWPQRAASMRTRHCRGPIGPSLRPEAFRATQEQSRNKPAGCSFLAPPPLFIAVIIVWGSLLYRGAVSSPAAVSSRPPPLATPRPRPTDERSDLVAITPAQFYLFPHVAAYLPGRVHRAVPQGNLGRWPARHGSR